MLSTPPAFILSQDQTLMLKCLSCQMSSGITVCLSCSISRTCSLNNSWISYEILMESSGLHYCLFVKVLRCLSRDSLFNISQPSALVNNFFIFLKQFCFSVVTDPSPNNKSKYSTLLRQCQHLISSFFVIYSHN